MTIHVDDLALTIWQAVRDQAPTRTEFLSDDPMRDTPISFCCVGRDWVRRFRITVETITEEDFEGDYQHSQFHPDNPFSLLPTLEEEEEEE